LRERLAALEGQVSTLMTMLGGNNGTKSLTTRKRSPKLLAPPD
jgi:hypothetical protein